MLGLVDFEPWWRFGVAIVIGALLGLEREFIQQKAEEPDIAGIRTFLLISLLGAITAYLSADYGVLPLALALGGLILLTAVSYLGALLRDKRDPGITTEVAVTLTFLFGVMVMGDRVIIAIALAVLTSLFLALKGRLHDIIRRMNTEDLRITFQFALVAAVILPLLPNQAIDSYGLINPYQIWLMVVLISGIGFAGYISVKVFGASQGINLTGILGGLASSTATTISFSTASRENPNISLHYGRAIVLASLMMMPRVLFLVYIISPSLLPSVFVSIAGMFVVGLLVVLVLMLRFKESEKLGEAVKLSNPLNLSTAIKFGLMFSAVLILIRYARQYFGSIGVYVMSAIAGLTDADAITLSVTRLFANNQITTQVAGISVVIAVIMNTISKGLIVHFTGAKELRRIVFWAYGFILFAGIIISSITFWNG